MSAQYGDDDLLPISALQHLAFCERQCALIHVERLWAENRLTVEGRQLHERVHDEHSPEARGDVRIARGLAIRSYRLGVSGVADVVEFYRAANNDRQEELAVVSGLPGRWRPVPVEYKRGRPKRGNVDSVQLCAQAICLEEMLRVTVAEGMLFYASLRRRTAVRFDGALRAATTACAARLHELISAAATPPARYEKRCERCSLLEMCLPEPLSARHSARQYLARALEDG